MNHVQIWHVVQITETPELKDHDRNKSAYFRRRLVFFDVTLNPHPKYIFIRVSHYKKNLKCFNFASCDVGVDHFIMIDPGESKVTIWPLATITDPCFNMQMYLFVQPWCNHKCNRTEWTKQQDHVHIWYRAAFMQMWQTENGSFFFLKEQKVQSQFKYCGFTRSWREINAYYLGILFFCKSHGLKVYVKFYINIHHRTNNLGLHLESK